MQPGATAPGTRIDNVAAMRWTVDGQERRAVSNAVTLVVAERLDVTLTRARGDVGAGDAPVAVRLTNAGSGREAFSVTATLPGATVAGIAVDRNGDGRFDPVVDLPLDGATRVLAPGETMVLLVLPPPGSDGTLEVAATAATGSGEPGRDFAGTGDGGGDAVVGPTGAAARVALPLAAADPRTPTLAKSQVARAPDGSARAVSGAVVTYTLEARFPAAAADARIDDPLPAGTAYLPGTMTLDGAALSDAADGDAGRLDAGAIRVALGDVAAAATRTVTFQVRLP